MIKLADNYLLEQFSEADLQLVLTHVRPAELKLGATVFEAHDAVDRVIFPRSGLLSVISVMESGDAAETSMVGRNGAVGFVEATGSQRMSSRVIVQAPGTAWIVSASAYRTAFDNSLNFRRAVQTNIELQVAELRQSIACSSLHRADTRLARWLLDCQDVSSIQGALPITQEFLSAMLTVQRTTVTNLLSKFQVEGLIKQSRGRIEIEDRTALEARSCECRRAIGSLRALIQPGAPEIHVPGQR